MTLDCGAAVTLGDVVAVVMGGAVGICVGCSKDEGEGGMNVEAGVAGEQAVRITLQHRPTITMRLSFSKVTLLFSKYTA